SFSAAVAGTAVAGMAVGARVGTAVGAAVGVAAGLQASNKASPAADKPSPPATFKNWRRLIALGTGMDEITRFTLVLLEPIAQLYRVLCGSVVWDLAR